MGLKIDRLLRELGWERQDRWNGYYSSIGVINSDWEKEGVDTHFMTGLYTDKGSPTLIRPLPDHITKFPVEQWILKTIEWLANESDENIKSWIREVEANPDKFGSPYAYPYITLEK